MTEKRFEPDCNDYSNQYDYSLLNSRYEANVERNEIIEWNKDACNAQYTDLERIAEKLNFKQMQLERCRKGYEELYEENKQLKQQIEKVAEANECLLTQKRRWEEMSDEYAKLHEENQELRQDNDIKFWKLQCIQSSNNNQIMLFELSRAIQQGYEVSDKFKQYLDEIKEHDKEIREKHKRLFE